MKSQGAWSDLDPGNSGMQGLVRRGFGKAGSASPVNGKSQVTLPPLCRLGAPQPVHHASVASRVLALGCARFLVLCQERVGDTPHTLDPPIPGSPNARGSAPTVLLTASPSPRFQMGAAGEPLAIFSSPHTSHPKCQLSQPWDLPALSVAKPS